MEIATSTIKEASDSAKIIPEPPPSHPNISVSVANRRTGKPPILPNRKRVGSPKPGKRSQSMKDLILSSKSNENGNSKSGNASISNANTNYSNSLQEQKHQSHNLTSETQSTNEQGSLESTVETVIESRSVNENADVKEKIEHYNESQSHVDQLPSKKSFKADSPSGNSDNDQEVGLMAVEPSESVQSNPNGKKKDTVVWARSGKGAPFWPSRFCTDEEIEKWPEKEKEDKLNPEEMPEGLKMKKMEAILEKVMHQDRFKWFCVPVDAEALQLKDYHDIIKTPMDLGTTQKKIRKNEYRNSEEIHHDIELTFQNALRYNPPGIPVHKKANSLLRFYHSEYAKTFGKPNKLDIEVSKFHIFYFGTHEFGFVNKANILPYYKFYDKFAKRKKSYNFRLALEEAEEELLREKHLAVSDSPCRLCGRISGKEDETNILICDRCYGEVHMNCMNPPLTSVPEGDFYCPQCVRDAPLTFEVLGLTKEDLDYTKPKQNQIKSKGNEQRKRPRLNEEYLQDELGKLGSKRRKSLARHQHKSDLDNDTIPFQTQVISEGPDMEEYIAKPNDNEVTQKKKEDSSCFICEYPGDNLISCDFDGCSRVYHKSCITHYLPEVTVASGQDKNESRVKKQQTTCPWHFCAICATGEPRNSKLNLPCDIPQYETPIVEEGAGNMNQLDTLEVNSHSSFPTFFHCRTCPLALCQKHADAPLLLIDLQGKPIIPSRISRAGKGKGGFFRCSYCRGRGTEIGNETTGFSAFTPPCNILLGRILIKIWSALVNVHSFHTCVPVSTNKLQIDNISSSRIPITFLDLKDKIWALRYMSLDEFKQDVEYVLQSHSGKNADEEHTRAFSKFHLILDEYIHRYKDQLSKIKNSPPLRVLDKAVEENNLVLAKTLYSHASFGAMPSLKEKGIETQMKSRDEEWAMRITNSNEIDLTENEKETSSKQAKFGKSDDAIGVLASLAEAADHNDNKDKEKPVQQSSRNAAPVSNEVIQNMLSEQARALQTCLINLNHLSKAVAGNSVSVQKSQDSARSEKLTAGEMRSAAEYVLANKNLKAQLSRMKELLKEEREKRLAAEESVRNLKNRLEMLASTAKILYTGTQKVG